MNSKKIIISILYGLSSISYITYLFAQKSFLMFCGGVLALTASIMLIYENKKKKN